MNLKVVPVDPRKHQATTIASWFAVVDEDGTPVAFAAEKSVADAALAAVPSKHKAKVGEKV